MALRIAGKPVGAPPTEPMPEELPEMPEVPEEIPEEAPETPEEPMESGGTLDPAVAGYRDPEAGPFKCSNCQYFEPPNSCHHVSGYVDPEAICNLFNPIEKDSGPEVPEEEYEQS